MKKMMWVTIALILMGCFYLWKDQEFLGYLLIVVAVFLEGIA